jgi:hypothetical protein
MRRSISVLMAAAFAATTMSLAPVQAATVKAPMPLVAAEGESVQNVGDGDRHWKKRRHADRHWKHRRADRHWRHDRRRGHSRHYSQFYFPFPFIAPYAFYSQPRYRCHGRIVYSHGRAHCLPYY